MAVATPFLDLLLQGNGVARRSQESAALPVDAAGSGSVAPAEEEAAANHDRDARTPASPSEPASEAQVPATGRAITATPDPAPRPEPASPQELTSRDPLSQVLAAGLSPARATPPEAQGVQPAPGAICSCWACRQGLLPGNQANTLQGKPPTGAAGTTTGDTITPLGSSVDLGRTFFLHSNPTATKTIYLDFDGNTTSGTVWNSNFGLTSINTSAYDFDGNVNVFSNAELERIQFIWQRVAEDFAPFGLDVTTQDPGADALADTGGADRRWGARAAIGGSYADWYASPAGGVSFIDIFGNAAYGPSFVFSNDLGLGDEKYTAEAISHEVGHALGLQHDGTSTTTYFNGQGSGISGWAPIMGSGYYKPVTQWSQGEYSDANNKQDDLAVISGSANGAGYRADDFGNNAASARFLSGTSLSQFGIIETRGDSDWFSFSTGNGNVNLSISSACQAWIHDGSGTYSSTLLAGRSPNLDIAASLYGADGSLIASSNPLDSLAASLNLNLSAGTYILKVDGVGFGDPLSTGYSDYGSLGQYLLSGTLTSTASLVISAPGTLLTSEAGGGASFSVRLSQAPTADVLVSLSSSDTGEGLLNTRELRFTSANWATDQSMTLRGVDDLLVDGNQAYSISLATNSADALFNGLQVPSLAAVNADNDTALAASFTASLGTLVTNLTYASAPTVVGKVEASASSDNVRLAISEGLSKTNGSRSSALDGYQWRFDNLVNANQFVFEGFRTANSESDNFQFQISSNGGGSWTNLLSVSNTSETTLSANLSAPINGSALVKVIDTNRAAGRTAIDTLYVDRLTLLGQQTDLRGELKVTTSTAQAVEDSGSEAVFTIQRGGDTSSSLDVAFSLGGTASLGSDYAVFDAAGNALNGSVRIAAGQASARVRIRPIADGLSDGGETVSLSLVAPSDMLRLGNGTDRVVLTDTLTGSAAPFTAGSDSSISGTVTGTAAATTAADGIIETIREVLGGSDANATSQLEQRWSFTGVAAATSFVVKATVSTGDDGFRFDVSANGGSSWSAINTLAAGFSGSSRWALNSSLSGDLLVRVVDTNRSASAGLIDSVAIDAMAFLASSTPLPF